MNLVQLALYLSFTKTKAVFSLSGKILYKLASQSLEPVPEKVVRIKKPEEKISVMWFPDSCDIRSENTTDIDRSTDEILAILSQINELAPIEQISIRRLTTYFILPTQKYTFEELEYLYRQEMFTSSSNFKGASDSSVIVDIKRGEQILHHQSGAMMVEQLQREFLRYDLKNIKKPFLFLEASMVNTKPVQYSVDDLHNFMLHSFADCKTHSEEFERIWGGKL